MKKLYNTPELEVLWFDEVETNTGANASGGTEENAGDNTTIDTQSFDSSNSVGSDLSVYSVENVEIK